MLHIRWACLCRHHMHACAIAVNGRSKTLSLADKDSDEILQLMTRLRDSCGNPVKRHIQPVSGGIESVQGAWDPSTTFDEFRLE